MTRLGFYASHEQADPGFDYIYLHVGHDQKALIEAFGAEALPALWKD